MPAKLTLLLLLCFMAVTTLTAQVSISGNSLNSTGYQPESFDTKDTVGSRLLLKDWVKGSIRTYNDAVVSDTTLLLNYDKINGELIVTHDMQTYLHAGGNDVNSFTLFITGGNYNFARVPAISNDCFLQVLSTGSKCTVYKKITTTIKKPDYHTDGITEYGNKYASFTDNITYYVVDMANKNAAAVKFNPTKKSLKEAFGFSQEKFAQYLSQHSKSDIDDDFIKGLGDYLNG